MKALVFAAGVGSRLKPFTLEHPKALAPVGGVPMLARVINKLRDAGVDEIVVNVHHFADQIIDFLKTDFGVRIHISDESGELLDTGGGLLKARKWLEGPEPFIVHNADILTDFDINEMVGRHLLSGADATLLVAPRHTTRYLYFNDSRLLGWANLTTGETRPEGFCPADSMKAMAFGGVHVVSPAIFDRLQNFTSRRVFSIVPFYVAMADTLKIVPFVQPAGSHWIDIGKPENLKQANSLFIK